MRFEGRVAVVTGGAGNIGRAVAEGFAAAGAGVAVVDVAATAEAVAELRSAHPSATIEACQADVASPEADAGLIGDVHRVLGGPHVLVTLAGGSLGSPRDLPEIAPDDLDRVLDVNLRARSTAARRPRR